MALVRYRSGFPTFSPWRELDDLHNRLTRLLDETFGTTLATTSVGWVPAVDIEETGDEIVLTAELPGMNHEDIDIELENNVLTLRGEKKEERKEEDQDRRFHLWERKYGSFERSFALPKSVDAAKISAEFDSGVLRVHMPKTAEAKGRRIEIKTKK